MTKNKRAKRDARDLKAAADVKYTAARRLTRAAEAGGFDPDPDFDDPDFDEDAWMDDFHPVSGDDDDSGYGPGSYFAHAMSKDD